MAPPKQLILINANSQNIKPNALDPTISILPNATKGLETNEPDHRQDFKTTYDFDDDDACYFNHCHKNAPDEEDNEFDVNENEYTNGALSRTVKVVYGKRNDCDGYNGRNDDEDFDAEDVDSVANEASPFFQEDDDIDKFDEQSFEDGDWAEEYEDDYYVEDDGW